MELDEALYAVGHSLNLVSEMATWIEHKQVLRKHLRSAALECFFINARRLAEFFGHKTPDRDLHHSDYGVQLRLDRSVRKELASIDFQASKWVAHLSFLRFPRAQLESNRQLINGDIDLARLFQIRALLLRLAEEFTAELPPGEYRRKMDQFVRHAHALTTWPIPPTAEEDQPGFNPFGYWDGYLADAAPLPIWVNRQQ